MTVGFEVYRQDGKVSISSTFPHYCFIKKIRGTGNFWDTSGTQYSDHVLVAFVPVNFGESSASSYRFSKGSRVLWMSVGQPNAPANATLSMFSNVQCDAYVYDITPTSASYNYGLQVHNEKGEITFDSNRRYMHVVDIIQSLSTWEGRDSFNDQYFTKTYSSNMKIAVCPLKFAYRNEYSGSAEEQTYYRTWESVMNPSMLRVTMVSAYEDFLGGGSGATQDLKYLCLVVNVGNVEIP